MVNTFKKFLSRLLLQLHNPTFQFDGSQLKIVAYITMFIDHAGAVLLLPLSVAEKRGLMSTSYWTLMYSTCRSLGRIAFPIFAFFIVEGFFHTSNRIRYLLRLVLLALISEKPYDLAMHAYTPKSGCNIYFTLILGFILVWVLHITFSSITSLKQPVMKIFGYVSALSIVLLTAVIADSVHCDYGYFGVGLIFMFYVLRQPRILQTVGSYAFISCMKTEWKSLPAFLLIQCYNGQRPLKTHFTQIMSYLFYPGHLLFLYIVKQLL